MSNDRSGGASRFTSRVLTKRRKPSPLPRTLTAAADLQTWRQRRERRDSFTASREGR
jgi:hypothetical protein